MKKKLVYAMLIAASMSLCACGGTTEAPANEEPVATEEATEETVEEDAETEETDAEETDAEETDGEETDAEETDTEETDADAKAGDEKAKELLDSIDRDDMTYMKGECNMSMTISAQGTEADTEISMKIEADHDYTHSFTDVTTMGQTVSVETWMDNATGVSLSQTGDSTDWVKTESDNAALADSMGSFHMDESAIAEYRMEEETDDYYAVYVATNPGYMNTLAEGQDVDYGDSYCECVYYFDKETESLYEVDLAVNIDNSAMSGYEVKDYTISFVYDDLIFGETDKTVTPPDGLF